ncbi:MAG: bifunctional pyr operon transcriptional regulator/uracil phosphoribosyltransferase PyrR [Verrucomicrobiales bacterium]
MSNLPPVADPDVLLDAEGIQGAVERLAAQIAARHPDGWPIFIGIERRGVPLAHRVATILAARHPDRDAPPVGSLDISLYRDDLAALSTIPQLKGSKIPFDVDGGQVVLFDDVLYTGRTIRAALEELSDFGRPDRVELAVLLDRGCRELPIQADFVGLAHPTDRNTYVRVRLRETDEVDVATIGHKEVIR